MNSIIPGLGILLGMISLSSASVLPFNSSTTAQPGATIQIDNESIIYLAGTQRGYITSDRLTGPDFFKINIIRDIRKLCIGVLQTGNTSTNGFDWSDTEYALDESVCLATDTFHKGSWTNKGGRASSHSVLRVTYAPSAGRLHFKAEVNSTVDISFVLNMSKNHYFIIHMIAYDLEVGKVFVDRCEADYCKRCDDSGSCNECYPPYIVENGLCVKACGDGFYQQTWQQCEACSPNCKACSGPEPSQCSQCFSGHYTDGFTQHCTECSVPCDQCIDNQYFVLHEDNCYSSCPESTYAEHDYSSAQCRTCSPNCKDCSADQSQGCIKCHEGYFKDDGTGTCLECPPNCNLCQEGLPFFLIDDICLAECPEGYFFEKKLFRNLSLNACMLQKDVGMTASLTNDPLTLTLSFKNLPQAAVFSLKDTVLISAPTVGLSRENCTVALHNKNSLQITLTPTRGIPYRTEVTISLDLPGYSYDFGNFRFIIKPQSVSLELLEYYHFSELENRILKASINTTNSVGIASSILFSLSQLGNTGGYSVIGAVFSTEMLQFHKFLRVINPPNLLAVYRDSSLSPISLTYAPEIPSFKAENRDEDRNRRIQDDGPWQIYSSSPYFLEYTHKSLLSLIILLGTFIVVQLSLLYKEKMPRLLQRILEALDLVFGFNFFLTVLISYSIQLSFFACTNLKHPVLDTSFGRANLVLSMLYILGFFYGLTLITKKLAKVLDTPKSDRIAKFPRTQTLFNDCRDTRSIQMFFLPILMTRAFFFAWIIVFADDSIIMQLMLLVCMNLAYLIYLIGTKPIKSKIGLWFQISADSGILVVNVLKIVLVSWDYEENFDQDSRSTIGWTIISINFCLIGADLTLSLINVASLIKDALTWVIKQYRVVNVVTPTSTERGLKFEDTSPRDLSVRSEIKIRSFEVSKLDQMSVQDLRN